MIENFKFVTDVEVRISDINYGGHLGNDRFLSIFQEARLRYLKQFGYSELSISENISLIMRQAHVDFKAEVFWGDQLSAYVRISWIKRVKFMFEYLIVSKSEPAKTVSIGYTEMVGFDYSEKKVKKLPSEFVQDIKRYEKNVVIF